MDVSLVLEVGDEELGDIEREANISRSRRGGFISLSLSLSL